MGDVKFLCDVPRGLWGSYMKDYLKTVEAEYDVDIDYEFVDMMSFRKIYLYNDYVLYQETDGTIRMNCKLQYPLKDINYIADYFNLGEDCTVRHTLWDYNEIEIVIEKE